MQPRRESDEAQLAADLRTALRVTATASVIGAPVAHSRLLGMIVRTAAHVLRAQRGSLLLVDEVHQELVFEVSTPEEAGQFQHVRVPLGTGIAGLVAMTGQPLAVSDVRRDPRHAAEIAQRIGYQPDSLLCVPLPYEDTVIGVIELLDKEGAAGFDASDMHALSLFAAQAAVAIEQSRAQRSLAALLRELLGSPGEGQVAPPHDLVERVSALAEQLELEPIFQRAMALAGAIHEVAASGPAETQLCLSVVRAVHEYVRAGQAIHGVPRSTLP